MITIKDVANRAQVSTATASRALRNIGYISKETYERVASAAAELGYIANSTAQQLKGSSAKTIGFIISDINNEYYFGILSNIQQTLNKHGMDLIIAFSSENPVDEETSFRSLIASRVSAILFTPTSRQNSEIIRVARQNGIKVIQLFRDIYEDLDTIINDDESGCRLAARRLLETGCKRLLLVDVEYRYLDFNEVKPNRSKGFCKALENAKHAEYKIINFPLVNYDVQQLYDTIDSFRPDGIITATNLSGIEVLSYLKKKKAEEKIRFITFDDNRWLELSSITSIKQNTKILTDTIYKFICSDSSAVKKESIPQTLIFRDSSK